MDAWFETTVTDSDGNATMKKPTIKIEFDNDDAAKHFATWLCESGEQSYWDWMEAREGEEDGDITAVSFHYHGPVSAKKPHGGGEFMADNTIRTTCGRMGRDW